jgi:hypothetical protein
MARQQLDRDFRFEAAAQVQFLPRCAHCGHRHPRAYMPPLAIDFCPQCGTAARPPGKPIEVKAVLTDARLRLARLMFRIGAYIKNLAERI